MPYILPPSSFARPADTTAYAASDLIANDTNSALVVPLSWDLAGIVDPGAIVKFDAVLMRKSTTNLTSGDFRCHLFNGRPTFQTGGDNGAFTANVLTGNSYWIGLFDVTASTLVMTYRDASGISSYMRGALGFPIVGQLARGSTMLYGLMEARAAYAPASAEIFSLSPILS